MDCKQQSSLRRADRTPCSCLQHNHGDVATTKKGSFLLFGCIKVPGLCLVWYSDGMWALGIPTCSHGGDGGLGSAPFTSLGMWMVAGRRQGREVLQFPPVLPPLLIPKEAQAMGNFCGTCSWGSTSPAQKSGHRVHTGGPSPVLVGFGLGFQECVAVPLWVSLSGLLSWCLWAMLWTASCSERSSIHHPPSHADHQQFVSSSQGAAMAA